MRKIDDRTIVALPSNMHHYIVRKVHGNGHFDVKKIVENSRDASRILYPEVKRKSRKFY